jgi:adenylosuccinate synthase
MEEIEMALNILVGIQWGDEGKGRITDLMAGKSDIVARYNGGDNAGHTVTIQDKVFKLHLIPSGIIHPGVICVLGTGMVINPLSFLSEVEQLQGAGIETGPQRLLISHLAHLITPAHRYLDGVLEEARGKASLGTTGRGIGPAYTDKAQRSGIRVHELLDRASLAEKVAVQVAYASRFGQQMADKPPLDVEGITAEYVEKALKLAPYIVDSGEYLRQALRQGKTVLAEGAQGSLLDIDYGTYPFVTSSPTLASGAFAGLGIGIIAVDRVLGVAKAFQTRVGAGPFPTEISGDFAIRLRGTGENPWDEFGATTGRPRRVGWHDGVLLRYGAQLNGLTELVITKLDILSGIPVLRVCTAYCLKGSQEPVTNPDLSHLEAYDPIYEELPGWEADLRSVQSWNDLPGEAQAYIRRLEGIAGVPVKLVSVGPERLQAFWID